MEQKSVKIGVLGLGRGAALAEQAFHHPNARITALCDINAELRKKAYNMCVDHGHTPEVFSDFEEFLQKGDTDIIIVANYATEHVPFVVRCLEGGKHVLSEIPAFNTVEELRILRAAVAAHPKQKYMLAENCNFWAFIQAWRRMYEEGALGEAIYCEAEYLHSKDFREHAPYPDATHWRLHNPAIKYCTHELGPLLQILDDRCVSVSCMIPDVVYNPYRSPQQNGVALFRTARGAVIRLLILFDAYVGFDHNYSIVDTRGSIHTDKNKPIYQDAHSFTGLAAVPGSRSQKIEIPITMRASGAATDAHGGADAKMVCEFIDCILKDTDPPIDLDLAIRMTLPGIIAAESAARGGELLPIPEL